MLGRIHVPGLDAKPDEKVESNVKRGSFDRSKADGGRPVFSETVSITESSGRIELRLLAESSGSRAWTLKLERKRFSKVGKLTGSSATRFEFEAAVQSPRGQKCDLRTLAFGSSDSASDPKLGILPLETCLDAMIVLGSPDLKNPWPPLPNSFNG